MQAIFARPGHMKGFALSLAIVLVLLAGAMTMTAYAQEEVLNQADDEMSALLTKWMDEKGPIYTWSQEDKAAYYQALADIGYARYPLYGNPGAEDMSQDEAINTAKALVAQVYGVDEAKLEQMQINANLLIGNPNRPEWEIGFFSADGESYTCIIESRGGRVMDICADSESNG